MQIFKSVEYLLGKKFKYGAYEHLKHIHFIKKVTFTDEANF